MTLRFMTTRAIGTAIALTISAGAVSAQTTPSTTTPSRTTPATTDTTVRSTTTSPSSTSGSMGTPTRVRKDGSSSSSSGSMGGMQVRKESSSGELTPTPAPQQTPAPTPASEPMATPAPTPAPVDSSSMMRDSSMSSSSTSTTTSTTTTTSTNETQPPMGRTTRFGNGLYFGVQGGANFPQNEINSYYETGYGAGAQLGWDPTNSPLGLRVNAMWNRLNGKDLQNATINGVRYQSDLQNADLYATFADAKLRLPFGRFLGATSGLYAVGGGGVTYFRNYNNFASTTGTPAGQNVTRTFNNEDVTRFALNGGGGLSFGVGAVSLFVEGRYVRVFTQGRNTDYVPVTLGLTFH